MMIKKLFTLLLLSIVSFGYSQAGVGTDSQQKRNIISLPTTADAYAFDKVGKLPIDLFRGKANINMPIYTVQTDEISLPISLSYNTGGIKLNEVAGIAGLGWAVSIPNSITQNIIDQDDKYVSSYSKNINDIDIHIKNTGVYDDENRLIIESMFSGNYDTRPDVFNYSLPTVSGSFIVSNGKGYAMPYDDIKIETFNNIKNVKVTDKLGNIFYLTPKNFSTYDNGESGQPNSNEALYTLDSIRTVSNKKIAFIYGKMMGYVEKSINERANILLTQKPSGYFESSIPLLPYERYEGSSANTEWLLTKIIFPQGEVDFQYSDDSNLNTVQGELYRKDLNSQNGVALRKVIVKDNAGKKIKDISLNYSYFESARSNKNYQDYRLKLMEVYDNLQNSKHSFTYHEETSIPARNSNNDDYWGYINDISSTENSSDIPSKVYTDYVQYEVSVPNSRNRMTNPSYSQLGTLNKIEYPTKGSKKLYYEPNKIFQTKSNYQTGLSQNFIRMVSQHSDDGTIDNTTDIDTLVSIPPSVFVGKEKPQIKLSFGNSCKNNKDDVSQIHETLCFGSATHDGQVYGSNGTPRTFTLKYGSEFKPDKPIEIFLNRVGNCRCTYSVDILYGQYTTSNAEIPVGGLRIKQIEDVNENNTTNVFNYDYQYFDHSLNANRGSGSLNLPFQYTHLRKKYVKQINSIGEEFGDPYLEQYLVVSNSGASYNSYASSDIVTYKQVTESNGLGKTINIFTQNNPNEKLYSHIYSKYNSWKDGLLEKSIVLNAANDTVRIQTNKFSFNILKNTLAGYNTRKLEEIAFANDIEITQYNKQLNGGTSPLFMNIYFVNKKYIPIESAKIENIQIVNKEFLNGKKIESKTENTYTDNDINKPINLKTTSSIFPSGENILTTYQYAHEKGNQLMIERNMVDIPLETKVTQTLGNTSKMLSKTETIYPTALPHAVAGNLVLPLSLNSYDTLNNTVSSTDVTYNKYDDKGNILQYTTKEGTPVSVVWGYNQTVPIAKIEGVPYSQIQNYISGIIALSDADAANPAQENALIASYEILRKDPLLMDKLVTTYTYDPLIGVTSITPPSGIREVYIYDTANRLKEVKIREKDSTGNYAYKTVKEFKYNYKP